MLLVALGILPGLPCSKIEAKRGLVPRTDSMNPSQVFSKDLTGAGGTTSIFIGTSDFAAIMMGVTVA